MNIYTAMKFLLIFLIAGNVSANIFGSDKRVQTNPSESAVPEVRAVGVVMAAGGVGYGTGWIVRDAKRTGCFVATNYHVAFMRDKGPDGEVRTVRAKVGHQVTFMIGPNMQKAGDFVDVITAKAVDFGLWSKHDWAGLSSDWAILKLDKCLGSKYGDIAYARPTESDPLPHGPLVIASFPGSRSELPGIAVEQGCQARDHGPVFGLIGVDCAFEGGASGAPVLARHDDGTWKAAAMLARTWATTSQVLPVYDVQRRNQAVSASSFYAAFDKIVGLEPESSPRTR
jgi:hypothetical protein